MKISTIANGDDFCFNCALTCTDIVVMGLEKPKHRVVFDGFLEDGLVVQVVKDGIEGYVVRHNKNGTAYIRIPPRFSHHPPKMRRAPKLVSVTKKKNGVFLFAPFNHLELPIKAAKNTKKRSPVVEIDAEEPRIDAEVSIDPVRVHPEPIPMILHCPSCGKRHIDRGEYATKPHHTHACQCCGTVWRPAVVDTVGVQFLPGFKDQETL